MSIKSRILLISSVLLFSLGLIIGLFIWTGSVWADLEGYMFQPATYADNAKENLKCPVLITSSDFGVLSMGFENRYDQNLKLVVRGNKSLGYVIYIATDENSFELKPGEKQVLHWYIYPEDSVWNRFVLFRANIISSRGVSLTTASCGVMVIKFPYLNSSQFLLLILLLGVIFIGGGIFLMYRSSLIRGKNNFYNEKLMLALTTVLIIGLLLALLDQWVAGGILLVGMYVFLMVTIAHFLQNSGKKPNIN